MGLSMKEKYAVIRQTSKRYQKSSKKKKTMILDEFVKITEYNRKYAIHILVNWGKENILKIDGKLIRFVVGKRKKKKVKRKKPRIYDEVVLKTLKKL